MTRLLPQRPGPPGAGRIASATAAAAGLLAGAVVFVGGGVGSTTFALLSLAFAAAIVAGVRGSRVPRVSSWWLFAGGVVAWGGAGVAADAAGVASSQMQVLLYVLGEVAFVAGIIGLLLVDRRERIGAILDGVITGGGSMLIVWGLFIDRDVSGVGLFDEAVAAVLPFIDAVLVGIAVQLLSTRRSRSVAAIAMVGGLTVMLTADSIWAFERLHGGGAAGLVPALWLVTYALLAASALHRSAATLFVAEGETEALGRSRFRIIAVVAIAAVASFPFGAEDSADVILYGLIGTPITIAIFARMALLLSSERGARAEAETSEANFAATLSGMADAFFAIDRDWRFVQMNDVGVAMVGGRTLVGECVWDAFPELEGSAVGAAYRRAMTERVSLDIEAEYEPLRLTLQLRILSSADGIWVFAHDISEKRGLESALNQAQRLEAIGLLAGGVAHDFNNLLTVIGGYTSLALERVDALHRHDLEEVLAATSRASDLTRQLLAFSRQQILDPCPLDLREVVQDSERLLSRLIGEDIFIDCNLQEVGIVTADRGQLEQVLMNLAINARDAMSGGGTLTIATSRAGARGAELARLTVQDTGCGMDADTLSRIFDPFFTTKAVGRGTGLGLATVHGIISQSGGSIDVASTPGRGTTFDIYLPVSVGAAAPTSSRPPAEARGGSETILLVEDEETVRNFETRILERFGYDVVSCATPSEAIAKAMTAKIDLLITDVVMPQMNGRELAERLHLAKPQTKVIYVSGYTPDEVISRGVNGESVMFLQKPFSSAQLAGKVRMALDQRAAA